MHAIGQTKANRNTFYNVGAIFDSTSSKPCERKTPPSTLVMAEKSQKPLSYFSNKESNVKTNLIKKAQQHKLLMKI